VLTAVGRNLFGTDDVEPRGNLVCLNVAVRFQGAHGTGCETQLPSCLAQRIPLAVRGQHVDLCSQSSHQARRFIVIVHKLYSMCLYFEDTGRGAPFVGAVTHLRQTSSTLAACNGYQPYLSRTDIMLQTPDGGQRVHEGAELDGHLAALTARDLRQITHALLRERVGEVAASPRGAFFDVHVTSPLPLGLHQEQRFRLVTNVVTSHDIVRLREEVVGLQLTPVVVAPRGLDAGVAVPAGIDGITPHDFARLCQESGMLTRDNTGHRPPVCRAALRELKVLRDAKRALIDASCGYGR
jgi:hypothetical protein